MKTEQDISARIKQKRREKGWSRRELARRLQLSPTYISLIERGLRVPSSKIAEKLARFLDDDQELYSHWSSLKPTLKDVREYETRLRGSFPVKVVTPDEVRIEPVREVESLFEDSAMPLSPKELSGMPEAGRITVSVIPEGVLPADPGAKALSQINIELGSLPPGERESLTGELFAYRISEEGRSRVEDLLQPGDYAVICQDLKERTSVEIYAVRLKKQIVLSRILRKGDTILALAPSSEDIEILQSEKDILGRVAIIIRPWQYAVFSPSDSGPT